MLGAYQRKRRRKQKQSSRRKGVAEGGSPYTSIEETINEASSELNWPFRVKCPPLVATRAARERLQFDKGRWNGQYGRWCSRTTDFDTRPERGRKRTIAN